MAPHDNAGASHRLGGRGPHGAAGPRQGLGNALLAGQTLDQHCALDAASTQFLHMASARLGWSARSFHRVLRVARTIADLAGEAQVAAAHLAEAIQLRRALPGG